MLKPRISACLLLTRSKSLITLASSLFTTYLQIVRRWYADTGLLSSWVCRPAPIHLVGLPGWSVRLDAVKRLQLNTAMTEILWCSTSRRQNHLLSAAVRVGENHVLPSTSVRDLGIHINSDVRMRSHVSRTVSGCLAVLRQLRSIRLSVSDSVFHSLVFYWSCHVSTMAKQHSLDFLRPSSVDFCRCSTPPPDWYTDLLSTNTSHRCCETFTGCGLLNASTSSWLCSSIPMPAWSGATVSFNHIQTVADSNRHRLRSSSSMQLEIRRTRLSTVSDRCFPWPDATFGTVCHLMSCQLQRSLFFGIASRHTSQDHFLHNSELFFCSYCLHCGQLWLSSVYLRPL